MEKHTPLRMCIACRSMKPKSELIRFVKKDEKVFIDEGSKIQARGAYMCSSKECYAQLKKKHCLERFLKCDTTEVMHVLENMFCEE